MKKLMIATAAIALGTSGVYATEGCCGVAASESETCKANVYEVKMSLKTLVTKKVTKNGCVGYYMDQGTRTINGYIWTCCDPCANLDNTEDYQITLWEKAAQVGIINGVGTGSASSDTKYTVSFQYTVGAGTTKFDQTLDGTFTDSQVDQAVTDWIVKENTGKSATEQKTYVANSTKATKVSATTSVAWADDDLACNFNATLSDPMFRFGKTAEKVAVQFDVAGSGAPNSNVNVDATKYVFYAAGFGTFDKKSMVAKSASGSVVGTLPSLELCDEYGALTYVCDDTFETWCDYTGSEYQVPAYGTWTAKYVKKMSKSLRDTVPSYNRQ